MTEIIRISAHHCTAQGSDKVWAMAILRHDQRLVLFSCWGKRGGALQYKTEHPASLVAAEKEMEKKVKEKTAKAYKSVPWTREDLGIEPVIRHHFPSVSGAGTSSVPVPVSAVALPRVVVSHVTPLPDDRLEAMIQDVNYGMTEKVNGVRCPVEWTGDGEVRSYNRQGKPLPVPPTSARALKKLGRPFLIDGERMAGDWGGGFIMFDLLEWDGQSVRQRPYVERIQLLTEILSTGLVPRAGATVTHASKGTLALLVPVYFASTKREVLAELKASSGEGVVFRAKYGPSVEGNSSYEWKHKFLGDIDAIVIGVKQGRKTGSSGSLRLGLYRPEDSAIIEVCSVRAGLLDADVDRFAEMLARGVTPVVRVAFLPARTVGISLVEPKTSIDQIRNDKAPEDCTTDQLLEVLGDDRVPMIAAAKPAF